MIPWRRTALIVLAAALASVCIAEISAQPPAPPHRPIALLPPVASPPPGGDATGAITTILARPLFRPDRRPVAVAARGDRTLPRLSGILIGPSLRLAMFTPAAGPTRLVKQGDRIGAYRVSTIAATAVTLTAPGVRLVLTPHFAGTPDAPPPSAPPDPPLRPHGLPQIQTPGRQ
jgi:general secretion pathway protein N